MLSAYLCLKQFVTTIHVINTFVRLLVSARYTCGAFHSFPLHSVVFVKKEFFLVLGNCIHFAENSPFLKHTSLIVVETSTNLTV